MHKNTKPMRGEPNMVKTPAELLEQCVEAAINIKLAANIIKSNDPMRIELLNRLKADIEKVIEELEALRI